MSGKALAAGSSIRAIPAASALPLTTLLDTYFSNDSKAVRSTDLRPTSIAILELSRPAAMSKPQRDSGRPNAALHVPVLPREVIKYLDLHPGQIVVDGTVGAGGHSQKILEHIGSEGTLIGLDRDPMMLDFARSVLTESNCILRHANYADLSHVLEELESDDDSVAVDQQRRFESVDRILVDLGLSSDQLADDSRGFGFQTSGPLDLRFDTSSGQPAWQLVEQSDEDELENLFREYGEERFSRKIAQHLVERRRSRPVRTAQDLVDAVAEALPTQFQRQSKKQPATRVFQALRIAVNEELTHLATALNEVFHDALSPGGRLVVITFHSLEDRLVKNAFRNAERWHNLTKKPVTATPTEVRLNPRSRTAKLRAAVKK